MAINMDRGSDKPREIVPEGSHVAVLYSIVEIGHVPNTYPGSEGQKVHQIRFTWEFPDEMRDFDGVQKPLVAGRVFTISLGDKSNLLPVIEGMVGKLSEEEKEGGIDFKGKLLGKACMVQIAHQTSKAGNTYAKVVGVIPLPKSVPAPAGFNPQVYLDYAEEWNDETYSALPPFVKDDMAKSDEMRARLGLSEKSPEVDPSEIPF